MNWAAQTWREMKRNRNAYLFISPFYLMFVLFLLGPILYSFVLSFQHWNGIMEPRWVGLRNYRFALNDKGFLNALRNTALFTGLTVLFSTYVSLALALFLNAVTVLKRFYRAVFFVPAIVSLVVVSLVWKLILNSEVGLIAESISGFGQWWGATFGTVPEWTTERYRFLDHPVPLIPLLTITLVNIWTVVGFNTVIYLAGLQGIPRYLYEASRIDGATAYQNLRYITLPILMPTTFFVVLISTIDALQIFVLPKVMKGDSEATMTVVYYLYQNAFEYYKMGYASAIAYLLFALTVVLGFLLRLTLGRKANQILSE